MDAIVSFAFNHPLLTIAIWLTLAGLVFSWFEQSRNIRSEHL